VTRLKYVIKHELAEALSNSLKALSSLGTDIKSMLTEFNEMKTNMEELVKRHQVKLDEIVGDSEPVNSFDIGVRNHHPDTKLIG
jgi:hypothetical protein